MFKKVEKRPQMTFQKYLSGMPARDYVFDGRTYEEQIAQAAAAISQADHVLIGAGAGLSAAAGLTYGGERFARLFPEFIEKYGMTDMYSAGFYPFPSEEARWGYWSKHVYENRIAPPALPLYQTLLELVKDKSYFVLTTNADHQFYKAEFGGERIFATQGDYGLIQCRRGCHPKTYDDADMVNQMHRARRDCLVPSDMVPKCPVCGGPMTMNLRCDAYFVEDGDWHASARRFEQFLDDCLTRRTVLLELGIGFNTPTIVRFPFERLAREHRSMTLVRLNLDEAFIPQSLGGRAIGINADMGSSIPELLEKKNALCP